MVIANLFKHNIFFNSNDEGSDTTIFSWVKEKLRPYFSYKVKKSKKLMDIPVANLLKHKIWFKLDSENIEYVYGDDGYRKTRIYHSITIINGRSIGVNDANDLGRLLKPFILHTLSTIKYEETLPIEDILISTSITNYNNEADWWNIISYSITSNYCMIPLKNYIYVPEHILQEPFFISVCVSYDVSEEIESSNESYREELESSDNSSVEEYTPPDETYRQDLCVICLENTPNILYLECKHIAIYDSCVMLRKNCDICRAEISRRVKI